MKIKYFRFSPAFGFETKTMNADQARKNHSSKFSRHFSNAAKVIAAVPLFGGIPVGITRSIVSIKDFYNSKNSENPMQSHLFLGRILRSVAEILGLGLALVVLDGIVTLVRKKMSGSDNSNGNNLNQNKKTVSDLAVDIPIVNEFLVSKKTVKKTHITSKSVGYFECCGAEYDKESGGYLYTFKIKGKYFDNDRFCSEQLDAINNRLYPAIIGGLYYGTHYFKLDCYLYMENGKKFSPNSASINKVSDFLYWLGYRFSSMEVNTNFTFTAPDERILNYRLSQLRRQVPSFPEFSVVSLEGVASDLEFAKIVAEGNLVLSNSKEFIHDHKAHIMGYLSFVCNEMTKNGISKEFKEYRIEHSKFFKRGFDNLEAIHGIIGDCQVYDCLCTFVGILADFSSSSGFSDISKDGNLIRAALNQRQAIMGSKYPKALWQNKDMVWAMKNLCFSTFTDRDLNELCSRMPRGNH